MNRMKTATIFFLTFIVYLFNFDVAYASFVHIAPDGTLTLNVLSYQSDLASFEITDVAALSADSGADVTLERDGDKVSLTVNTTEGTKLADVTDYTEEVIQIEETYKPKTINIYSKDDYFVISQNSIEASTKYSIQVKSSSKEIGVETDSGVHYLSVLPSDAYISLTRANIIDDKNTIEIIETEEGDVVYSFDGTRFIDLFRLVEFSIPVTAKVSVASGKVIEIDAPIWFRIVGFIFS